MPQQQPISVVLTGNKDKTAELFRKYFPNLSPEQVVRAAGVVDGMDASISDDGDSLLVTGRDKHYRSSVFRYFHPVKAEDGSDHLVLEHTTQEFHEDQRGKGYQRFADQLKALEKLPQVKKIHIPLAAGTAGSSMYVGSTVWPLFGFNAPLTSRHRYQLSPDADGELSPNADFHELFSNPKAVKEWRENPAPIEDMEFDLHPQSEHRKRFQAYYEDRSRREAAKAVRNPVPEIPSATVPEKAYPYRTASRIEAIAETLRVRYRLRAAQYKQELSGGKWKGKPLPKTLVAEGAAVEKEHTNSSKVAAEIAKDHLTESRDYYPKLKITERLTLKELKAALRRKGNKVKYATEQPVAHPSVAGFQLEHALRRAISDPETSSDLKTLSHTLLTKGVERSDAAYGIHDEVESLHPDHWFKKANYNWSAIPHKLHLDAAVGHAIDAVVRVRKQQSRDLHDHHHRFGSTEAIAHFVENPEDFDTADRSEAHSVAQEAAEELLKSHSVADLIDSLERHQTRNQSLRNADPTFRGLKTSLQQEQTAAAMPLEGWPDRYAAKGKNPEGGLTVAEARRQGVRAGSETKNAAKKAGGFSKIEGKTQARRKSFCSRMCGAAKQHPEAAKDPDSRLRASLRIWGCRCNAKKG